MVPFYGRSVQFRAVVEEFRFSEFSIRLHTHLRFMVGFFGQQQVDFASFFGPVTHGIFTGDVRILMMKKNEQLLGCPAGTSDQWIITNPYTCRLDTSCNRL